MGGNSSPNSKGSCDSSKNLRSSSGRPGISGTQRGEAFFLRAIDLFLASMLTTAGSTRLMTSRYDEPSRAWDGGSCMCPLRKDGKLQPSNKPMIMETGKSVFFLIGLLSKYSGSNFNCFSSEPLEAMTSKPLQCGDFVSGFHD